MELQIIRQVSSRWSDGRTFAAMPGRRVTVDDQDLDLVAHMRHLIAVGDAEEITPEPEPDPDPPADKAPAKAAKATAAKAASDE